MTPDPYYVTAEQAAALLGVTRATLYAYASRGQVRSEPVPGPRRERRYSRQDIERLRDRKEARRDPGRAAARGLHWGAPVLESGITLIDNGRFFYRGRDASVLAESWSAEQVAALLWTPAGVEHDEREATQLFDRACPLTTRQLRQVAASSRDPLVRLQVALPMAAAADPASYDLRPAAVRLTGARIVRLLTAVVGQRDGRRPVHDVLQHAWAPDRKRVADVIRTSLVLCADHELNVSAFAARCAASAGASPYDVVGAALATLKGHRHGGAAKRVAGLVAHAQTAARARSALAERLRLGDSVPGFGHPLYPSGDPRAVRLIALAEAAATESAWRPLRFLLKAGADVLHDAPNLDFGLAAITRVYRLPEQAPLILFALARTIGWIAHAIEQYASGQLIRPRARYTGPGPVPSERADARPINASHRAITSGT